GLHRRATWAVTKSCGVIDVIRANEPRGFLRHVINFVRYTTRRDEERDPSRITRANPPRDAIECIVPRDPAKSFLAALPQHRVRQAPELAQLLVVEHSQSIGIGQD